MEVLKRTKSWQQTFAKHQGVGPGVKMRKEHFQSRKKTLQVHIVRNIIEVLVLQRVSLRIQDNAGR